MHSHAPFLMRRMLALRQFPLWRHADLAELAMVAENADERAFDAGDVIEPGDSLHLLLEGRIVVADTELVARDVFGGLEVAARLPRADLAIAREPTRTLELGASDYFEVLEDHFRLLLATIRDYAARALPLGDLRRPLAMPFGESALGLVERMILLRHQVPFSAARLEALAILAHAATEVHWPAGATVVRARTPADRSLIVLAGSLHAPGRDLEPGHALGVLETLAGVPYRETFEAATPVRALSTSAGTLRDVLEDHTDFALSILETFARALVDHEARKRCMSRSPAAETAQDPARSWPNGWRAS